MNVIIMYADDLGFGDVGCYGSSRIPTPNIDRLADEGLKFNQGYATAATCTPSRYSLLTGSYPWRNPRAAILAGDAPSIINKDQPTMAGMFKRGGFKTGIVGKWHLGLGTGRTNWNEELEMTPNDVGFDESFIMAATNDRVPCVYLDNRNVLNLDPQDPIEVAYGWDKAFPGLPTGRDNPELLNMMYSHGHDGSIVNGVSRIGHMRGGKSALWNDETMAETFLARAKEFITSSKDQPFFLYYAFHEPHVPRIPSPRFNGATQLGPRGDVIAEMDWCVGEILDHLESENLKEETIVIFSSDNGPVLDDGYQDRAEELTGSHKPAGPLRGGKYSMYDGGTRVPFVLSWPGKVTPGESDALLSHVDFHASFAFLIGLELSEEEAPDSFNVMDALLGRSDKGRDEIVLEGRRHTAILRQQDWTYIPPHEGPAVNENTHTELGNSPDPQLYDLSSDIGQIRNLARENPEQCLSMEKRYNELRSGTRTRQ